MELEHYKDFRNQIKYFLPEIKTIRLWNEQILHSDGVGKDGRNENAFQYPAVFIEYHELDGGQLSAGVTNFNILVTTRLCFKSFETEDLEILKLKEKLYYACQRFQSSGWARLSRIRENPDSNHGNIQVFITDYKSYGTDTYRYILNTGNTTTITGITINDSVVEVPSISITASGSTSDNGDNQFYGDSSLKNNQQCNT